MSCLYFRVFGTVGFAPPRGVPFKGPIAPFKADAISNPLQTDQERVASVSSGPQRGMGAALSATPRGLIRPVPRPDPRLIIAAGPRPRRKALTFSARGHRCVRPATPFPARSVSTSRLWPCAPATSATTSTNHGRGRFVLSPSAPTMRSVFDATQVRR